MILLSLSSSRASSRLIRSTSRPGTRWRRATVVSWPSVGQRELIPDEGLLARLCVRAGPRGAPLPRADPNATPLNNDPGLSRPRMPEWLDKRIGERVEEHEEQEEIRAGLSSSAVDCNCWGQQPSLLRVAE